MMSAKEMNIITLTGGPPWGFRLTGGGREPLKIAKVRKRSKADNAGLKAGDTIVTVNSCNCEGSSLADIMNKVDSSHDNLTMFVKSKSQPENLNVGMHSSFPSENSENLPRIATTTNATPLSTRTADPVETYAAEENKRVMRERYAINSVFLNPPKPGYEAGTKVRSEENLRSTSHVTPMYNSVVGETKDIINKENVTPVQRSAPVNEIPKFNVRNIVQEHEDIKKHKHRSMDGGLNNDVPDSDYTKHLFGPRIAISLKSQQNNSLSASDPSILQKKKQFSDSAFYDDPEHSYPTIEDQMKLCQTISRSLTATANQKARGARMFAKRQKRSPFWIHDGQTSAPSSEFSSECSENSSLEDLQSELSVTDGGNKPLFQFRIPKIAQQVAPVDLGTKMSLSRNEYENLRLNKQRCEHNAVSPVTCFNIAADLQNSKGRGARIFEKRRQHADAWVVNDENVKKANPPENKLEKMININSKQNSIIKQWNKPTTNNLYTPLPNENKQNATPTQNVVPIARTANLTATKKQTVLEGPTFNRTAKGWMSQNPTNEESVLPQRTTPQNTPPVPAPKPQPQFRDYNSRARAYRAPSEPLHQVQESYNTFPRVRKSNNYNTRVMTTSQTNYGSYPSNVMAVGSDL